MHVQSKALFVQKLRCKSKALAKQVQSFALFVHSNEKALNLLTNQRFVLVKDATLKTRTKQSEQVQVQIFDL